MGSELYAEDSFFTLSLAGRAGLICVSAALALGVIVLTRFLTRGLGLALALRLSVGLGLFWLFLWLSPQAYYTYYRLIFDGLPAQWVIRAPHTPARLLAVFAFSDQATLSAHGKAYWGGGALAAAVLATVTTPRIDTLLKFQV